MAKYETVTKVTIDDDAKVIQFSKKHELKECHHKRVTILESSNTVVCDDCNAQLDPIHWFVDYLSRINSANNAVHERLAKAQVIEEKLQKKSTFMCKKCHEVNTIDFHRLPSAAAVKRRMAVIEQEDSDNYRVEVIK